MGAKTVFLISIVIGLSSLFCTVLIGMNHVVRTYTRAVVAQLNGQRNEYHTFGVPSEVELASRDNAARPARVSPSFMSSYAETLANSDIVDLEHCSLDDLDWQNFTSWSRNVIERVFISNHKFENLRIDEPSRADEVEKEWTMELLEMYVTHGGWCDFDDYHFGTIKTSEKSMQNAGLTLTKTVQDVKTPPMQARLAIVIVAFQDSEQLQRLIEAVILPQHLIVIHLDKDASGTFRGEVDAIASGHPNVAVLQFGKIVYETDSISRINLQIMAFLVNSLHLEYDYHVAIDGAAFPLIGANELAEHLYASDGNVWLGDLTHKGEAVHSRQYGLLWKKRLYASIGPGKLAERAGVLFPDHSVPAWLDEALHHKSTSGNQAIFSFQIVRQLLSNRQVKEMFAIAKYGCCCCLEERTWIAAMHVLGWYDEAQQRRGMYQLWGGFSHCRGSMTNAVLEMNETICYRSEDARGNDNDMYFRGNTLWESLRHARQQGTLFARKFHSRNVGSMQLLDKIVREMHGKASSSGGVLPS
jgi:Core-2/I-Branching enzyme